MATVAYWVVGLSSTWPGTPNGGEIVAGQLSGGGAALASGSEAYAAGFIDEATAISTLSDGTNYKVAWVVWDGTTYSNVVVSGDITTESLLAKGIIPLKVKKPSAGMRLNPNHWLADDIIFAFDGERGYVGGAVVPPVVAGPLAPKRSSVGRSHLNGKLALAPDNARYATFNLPRTVSMPLTIAAWNYGTTGGLGDPILSLRASGTVAAELWQISDGQGSDARIRDAADATSSAATTTVATTGEWKLTAGVFRSATSRTGFTNATEGNTSTTSRTADAFTTVEFLRAGNSGVANTSLIGVSVALVLRRELTTAEIQRLYYEQLNDPWSVFLGKTRPIPVVQSATTDTAVTPGAGAITVTGYAPTLEQPQSASPTAGAITVTGYAPTLTQPQSAAPTAGAITVTGYAPTLEQPQSAAPTAGAITVTGYAPDVQQSAASSVSPTAGAITVTGYEPTLTQPQSAAPTAGALTLTGYALDVQQSAAGTVQPGAGAITVTGYAPTLTQPQSAAPTAGAITVTGYAPEVLQGAYVSPSAGAVAVTGYAPTIEQTTSISVFPSAGQIIVTGYAPTVVRTGTFAWTEVDTTQVAGWGEVSTSQAAGWIPVNTQ